MAKEKKSVKNPEPFTKSNSDSLREALNEMLFFDPNQREYELNEFRGSSVWWCATKLYISKVYPEAVEPIKRGLAGIFMWGKKIHKVIQNFLKTQYPLQISDIERELTYIYKNIEIIAHCDGVWFDRLIEFKSANHWSFKHRLDEQQALHHDCRQANMMAFILKLPKFSIVYIDKGCSVDKPQVFEIFTYQTNEEQAIKELDRLDGIYLEIVISEEAGCPKPDCYKWECRYCPVKVKCKSLGIKPDVSIVEQVNQILKVEKL